METTHNVPPEPRREASHSFTGMDRVEI